MLNEIVKIWIIKKVMEDMKHLVETFRILLDCDIDDEVSVTWNDKEIVFQRIK